MSPKQIEKSMRSSTGLGHAGALGKMHEHAITRNTLQTSMTKLDDQDGFIIYNSKTLQQRKLITKGLLKIQNGSETSKAYLVIDFQKEKLFLDEGRPGGHKS